MKIIYIILFLVLVSACSKQESNGITQPAIPIEDNKLIRTGPPQCVFTFTSNMTPTEVATIALKMQDDCKMSESSILEKAEKF